MRAPTGTSSTCEIAISVRSVGLAGPRLTLLVLLIRVAGQSRAVGDILLAQAGALTYGAECRRDALRVYGPFALSRFVRSGHLLSVVTSPYEYGLIRMA